MAIASPLAFMLIGVIAFLLGSFPSGVIISRVFYKKDIRDAGSGNIGTTNALRTMGKRGGAAVFLLDFGKGVLAALIGLLIAHAAMAGSGILSNGALFTYDECMAWAFFCATMGHIFSPWLGFRGGKGIAVAVGALCLVYGPVGVLIEFIPFIALIAATRYVSLGSLGSALICPFLGAYFFWGDWLAFALVLVTACVVIWAHRANIGRLRAGTEHRIGGKKEEGDNEEEPA